MGYMYLTGIVASIILVGVLIYIACRCMMLWRHTPIANISAAVIKDKNFLSYNYNMVMIIGGLAGMHVFMELAIIVAPLSGLKQNLFNTIYFLDLAAIMLILMLLTVSWYKLLSNVNR